MQVPCRILIGPLYNPALIGAYAQDPNIRIFMPKSGFSDSYAYDLVYDLDTISHFNQIFAGLGDWEPELVLWWDPVYQTIPPGIEACPYPIALIPGDWNLAFLSVLQSARGVDAVFADGRLGPILTRAGIPRVYPWPGFAFDSRLLYREPLERIHDVCFIGNMNPNIHPRRSRYLAQLLSLQDRYRLFLRHGVWGDDYRRALNQSRIVLNYTICQVMNMRAYEAPACGALLMIEEDNVEVRDVFEDRVSCVLYNEQNLLGLIEYYLEHEDERAAIAEAGYSVVQDYSYERHFERLLVQIPALLDDLPPRRPSLDQPAARRQLYALNQISASNPQGARSSAGLIDAFWRALKAEGLGPERVWELNALMVLLFPYLDEQQELQQAYGVPLSDLLEGFETALSLDFENPVLRYHHALTCEYLGQDTQALWSYSYAVELMARGHRRELSEYRDFVLPFNKSGRGLDQLAFEWERISYEAIEQGEDPGLRYLALLGSSIWQRIGRILQRQGQHAKALVAYENAFASFARANLQLELARLHLQLNQPGEALIAIQTAVELQPLLVGQLVDLLTPELLIQYADWIHAATGRYRLLYPVLDRPHLLAGLVRQAQGQDLGLGWRDLLPLALSPDFYHWLCLILQRFEASPGLKVLQPLRRPLSLRWGLPLERPPRLDLACGLFWSDEPGALLLSEAPGELQRIYDGPSRPAEGICGLDRFPCQFVPGGQKSELLSELLGEASRRFLVVLAGWTPERLGTLLQAYEAGIGREPDCLLLLWSPPGCHEIGLSQLEAVLPDEMQAQLAWIDEDLGPEDQAGLIEAVDGLLALPGAKGMLYSYWAVQVGKPVCWLSQAAWLPEQGQGGFALPVIPDPSAALAALSQAPPPPPLPGHWHDEPLRNQAWLNALWQQRLYLQYDK